MFGAIAGQIAASTLYLWHVPIPTILDLVSGAMPA